MNIMMDPNYTL